MPGAIERARTLAEQWKSAPRRTKGLGRSWAKRAKAYLRAHPFCAECGKMAEDVHHVRARADGGGHEWENLEALCKVCHSRKTREEQLG